MAQDPNEIFDIVNEQDEVIGQATRERVHAEQLWHRATHILVHNNRGEVLLQKRSAFKDTYPGTWTTSCAGHVDTGESYLACAVRELHEELGLQVLESALSELGKAPPSAQTGWEWLTIYRMVHDGPFTHDAAEVAELRWLEATELDNWIASDPDAFAPSFIYVWQTFGKAPC